MEQSIQVHHLTKPIGFWPIPRFCFVEWKKHTDPWCQWIRHSTHSLLNLPRASVPLIVPLNQGALYPRFIHWSQVDWHLCLAKKWAFPDENKRTYVDVAQCQNYHPVCIKSCVGPSRCDSQQWSFRLTAVFGHHQKSTMKMIHFRDRCKTNKIHGSRETTDKEATPMPFDQLIDGIDLHEGGRLFWARNLADLTNYPSLWVIPSQISKCISKQYPASIDRSRKRLVSTDSTDRKLIASFCILHRSAIFRGLVWATCQAQDMVISMSATLGYVTKIKQLRIARRVWACDQLCCVRLHTHVSELNTKGEQFDSEPSGFHRLRSAWTWNQYSLPL